MWFYCFKHFIKLLHSLYLWLAALYILILCHKIFCDHCQFFFFLARIFQEERYPIDEETVSIRWGLEETHKEKYGWMKFSRGYFESWLRKCKHQVFDVHWKKCYYTIQSLCNIFCWWECYGWNFRPYTIISNFRRRTTFALILQSVDCGILS